MARLFNGSSDYLSAAIDLSAYSTLTLAFWLYWDSYANDFDMAMEFTADGIANAGFTVGPNWNTGVLEIAVGGGSVGAMDYARPSAATWHHYVMHLDRSHASGVPKLYVDGSELSGSVGSAGAPGGNFASDTLYFMSRAGSSLFGAGRMAEVGLWPGALLDAGEAAALGKGAAPPMVRPGSLLHYWPLLGRYSPEINLRGGTAATVSGASQTDHPRVYYPAGPLTLGVPAAVAPAGTILPHMMHLCN